MFCIHCGKALPEEARFCYSCGAAQGNTKATPGARSDLLAQGDSAPRERTRKTVIYVGGSLVALLAIGAVALAVFSGGQSRDERTGSLSEKPVLTPDVTTATPSTSAATQTNSTSVSESPERAAGVATPTTGADVRAYSYISPAATNVLRNARITDKELEAFADAGLTSRAIKCIGSNAVYEGSEDSLRLDIREQPSALIVELSVRQGASVHNMLQRWSGRRVLAVDTRLSREALRAALFNAISALLDDLKERYDSPQYRQGEMMEE